MCSSFREVYIHFQIINRLKNYFRETVQQDIIKEERRDNPKGNKELLTRNMKWFTGGLKGSLSLVSCVFLYAWMWIHFHTNLRPINQQTNKYSSNFSASCVLTLQTLP